MPSFKKPQQWTVIAEYCFRSISLFIEEAHRDFLRDMGKSVGALLCTCRMFKIKLLMWKDLSTLLKSYTRPEWPEMLLRRNNDRRLIWHFDMLHPTHYLWGHLLRPSDFWIGPTEPPSHVGRPLHEHRVTFSSPASSIVRAPELDPDLEEQLEQDEVELRAAVHGFEAYSADNVPEINSASSSSSDHDVSEPVFDEIDNRIAQFMQEQSDAYSDEVAASLSRE